MHLVLDPAQDAAHGDWLRHVPGAYEWWYFDARSDDAAWSLTCIWFLGNPFSPYYRMSALGSPADPFTHNAVFFGLHRHGALAAYHFTRFSRGQICADEALPATLRFGPNRLFCENGVYRLQLTDENANRRTLSADMAFTPFSPLAVGGSEDRPSVAAQPPRAGEDNHFWLPAAPACRVAARITLKEHHNSGEERIHFTGHGYHDHNWGRLPFASDIQDWYWARTLLDDGRVAVLYHVNYRRPQRVESQLLLFEQGRMISHDPQAAVTLGSLRVNAFGTRYATRLEARSGGLSASFSLDTRLDSSPFYVRTLSRTALEQGDRPVNGVGMAEYFCPRFLGTALAASATKARIVAP